MFNIIIFLYYPVLVNSDINKLYNKILPLKKSPSHFIDLELSEAKTVLLFLIL